MNHRDAENLLFFIDKMIDARESFDLIRHDENERHTSTYLGRQALYYGIIILIFIGGAAALVIWGITMESGWKIALFILAGLVAVAMLPFYLLALNYSVKQLRVNRRAIGWISLLLPLLVTIAAAVCIVVFAV